MVPLDSAAQGEGPSGRPTEAVASPLFAKDHHWHQLRLAGHYLEHQSVQRPGTFQE